MSDIIERMNEAMGEYEKALRKYGNPLAAPPHHILSREEHRP